MRQPRTKKVTFMVQEHLRLVNKTPERGGVSDAVAVPLLVRAGRSSRLRVQAPFAVGRMTGKRGKIHGFALKRALLANSSDGNRRTSVNDDFDVRHLSSASLVWCLKNR